MSLFNGNRLIAPSETSLDAVEQQACRAQVVRTPAPRFQGSARYPKDRHIDGAQASRRFGLDDALALGSPVAVCLPHDLARSVSD